MKRILEALRGTYKIELLITSFFLLISLFGTILFGYFFFSGGKKANLILLIACAFITLFLMPVFCNRLSMFKNPLKSAVFKKYGGVEKASKLFREIEQSTEFDDGNIIISREYIVNPKNLETLISCAEVSEAHILEYHSSSGIDRYDIVITVRSGSTHYFTYSRGEEVRCEFALDFLQVKCGYARFGPRRSEHYSRY